MEEKKDTVTTNPSVNGEVSQAAADVDAVMKKFDRESNTRIWTGVPGMIVKGIVIAFSLWCIWVTLFATFLEEIRLTSFLGLVILMGFLVYPAKKGEARENYMPWYDIVLMLAGMASYFYFTFHAQTIIQQGTRFTPLQIVIGIVGIVSSLSAMPCSLASRTHRSTAASGTLSETCSIRKRESSRRPSTSAPGTS